MTLDLIQSALVVAFILMFVISGFSRDVDEICALLGYYAASSGNPLPTFRKNVSASSSRVKKPCPETSVKDYHSTLRNIPEEGRSDSCVI
jgi:hypothetical protein